MRFTRRLPVVTSAILAGALATTPLAAQAGQQVTNPPNARPGGGRSTAARVGDVVDLARARGTGPGGGGLAEGGIQGQTREALENITASATLAGVTMEDMVKCTVFLTDVKDFQGMNQVYREFFPKDPPARSTVAVAGLVVPGAVIEIECIAAAKPQG